MKYRNTPKPYLNADIPAAYWLCRSVAIWLFRVNISCIGCVNILLSTHLQYCVPSTSLSHFCCEINIQNESINHLSRGSYRNVPEMVYKKICKVHCGMWDKSQVPNISVFYFDNNGSVRSLIDIRQRGFSQMLVDAGRRTAVSTCIECIYIWIMYKLK